MAQLRDQDQMPAPTDSSLPRFTLLVGHSPFTMPRGWEYYLTTPYEGATSIATSAYNAGFPTRIVDVRYAKDPVGEAYREIRQGTDILGVCTFEDNFPFTRDLIACLKETDPRMLIIAGGSLVTSVPRVFMANTGADIGVISEGELTILELLESYAAETLERDLPLIRGVIWRDEEGQLAQNQPRGQLTDLDCLPRPRLELWPQANGPPGLQPQLITSYSRGCKMDCSFCFRTTPKVASKSLDKWSADLTWLKERYGAEFLFMSDLTFNADRRQTVEMCEVLQDHSLRFTCMCRCADADAERLDAMRRAGCDVILYGVESLSTTALRGVHKPTVEGVSLRALRRTEEAGIRFGALLILGLPGETEQGLVRMVEFAEQHHNVVRVKYLQALPGTSLYRELVAGGKIRSEVDHLNWLSIEQSLEEDEFLNLSGLPEQALRQAFRRIYRCYQPGPVMDFEHWPDRFEYHLPIADGGGPTSVTYGGPDWRARFSSAGPYLAPGSEKYTLDRCGIEGAAEAGAALAISGAKRMAAESETPPHKR